MKQMCAPGMVTASSVTCAIVIRDMLVKSVVYQCVIKLRLMTQGFAIREADALPSTSANATRVLSVKIVNWSTRSVTLDRVS